MRLLDDGIRSAEKIEDKLDFYDSILQVNESLFAIKKKNYKNYFLPRKTYLKINCMILFLKHGGLNYKFHCNYRFQYSILLNLQKKLKTIYKLITNTVRTCAGNCTGCLKCINYHENRWSINFHEIYNLRCRPYWVPFGIDTHEYFAEFLP